MKRRMSALSIFVLLALALGATFTASAAVDDRDRRRPHPTTTTTRPPTTTTTRPTTTTTTRPPTTTTTRPPATTTTTTLPPTTTTTTLPPGEPSGDRFVTLIRGDGEFGGQFFWDADYFRVLPWVPNTGWTDGDRQGYRCFYAFLYQGAAMIGRVTFVRVDPPTAPHEDPAYGARINDQGMAEGVRYYNGTLAPDDAPRELGDCNTGRAPFVYETSNGPWQLPTVTYETTNGTVLEIRNYKATVTGAGITFRQTESTDRLVTVVAYKDGLPVVVVYYESLIPGVVMNSDLG